MIEEILPDSVVAIDAFGNDLIDAELFPEEEQVIARAVDKRRHEFTAARACSRLALAKFGLPPMAIPTGEKGAPQWPPGMVGSITHCAGYRAAAVARGCDVAAIGIDAEPHGPLPDGVLEVIATPEELAILPGLASAAPHVHWDRLLFSAKESIYKAWFPLARRWLGYEEAVVTADPGGTFTARLLVPEEHSPLGIWIAGRWMTRHGLVATAIAFDVSGQPSPPPPPPPPSRPPP